MDEAAEVVVRVRADGATELRVNGVFVMDDVETSSERLLAELVLDVGAREVLVGGLGLGYTAQTDAVLLDVDNGPDFLVHETNAAVYAADGLADAARVLRPGGTLAVWSMADSAPLRARLAALLDDVRAVAVPVDLQGRSEHYWVLTGRAR
ncbi:hypothetical protein [Aeromicrobium sp. REDSEA-S32_B7]|uniref:hypothetical protein n=1 Tax=Aeromicrobium sp. REDSEA-S32_B7 TaxID=1811526 RepID=UPI000B211CDD|nr:hypothetical protein [Aeromicrobium sp. REDSEA-S32_B7]